MPEKSSNLDLILGTVIVLIFVGFSYSGLSVFEGIEGVIYDTGIRLRQTGKPDVSHIVLIDIDDKSIASLGSWPWPRHLIAEMVSILDRYEARLIGLNIPFYEKELNQGFQALQAFREKFSAYPFGKKDATLTAWILKNLQQAQESANNDKRLVETVQKSGHVILPILGQSGSEHGGFKTKKGSFLFQNALTAERISDSLRKRISAKQLSVPFVELGQNALGLGHGNLAFEENMLGRSHPMFIGFQGSLYPSFPLRLAMAYLNQQPKQVLVQENQIQLNGYSIPILKGEMLIQFKNKKDAFLRYSFVDILQGKRVAPILKGKIILVGLNNRDSRRIPTPISKNMSEAELSAHILDNIINKRFIVRAPSMAYIEILAIVLLGGLTSFIFPRIKQLSRLGWMMGITCLTVMAGLILISAVGIWLKTAYVASCIFMIYLVLSVKQLITAEWATRESIETKRLLALNFQSQGLLDLAFEEYRKLPQDNETKELIYNLGLEYERKGLINEAISVYEHLDKDVRYKDLAGRVTRLKESQKSSALEDREETKDTRILTDFTHETISKIGRYKILGELGRGSMGLVYKALDPRINRLLAIKTIRFSDEFEEDVLQEIKSRFFREAEIAGQLSHPSIVTIHDIGDDQDLTYMAMEYLEGESLNKYVNKERLLPFREVLDVVAQVADALDFAHRAEVIHRDIKPANIMLLKNGRVKVTDFGIAKAISSSRTKTGVILGTPNYMSPEQIMGQKIDPRSDIFSLGVLFFQLLTGELPFRGNNLSSLLYQITQVENPSLRNYNPKTPKACDQIIDKALAKNPKERFRSGADMAKIVRLLGSKIDQLRQKKSLKNNRR